MSDPVIDETTWPIVVVTFADSMSGDEIYGYFDRLRALLKRRERFAVVLDARRIGGVDAVRRKQHGDFLASIDGLDRFVAAAALVVDEEMQRGLLTAIFWFHKPRFPIERFEGLGEAMLWARERVREREETARRSGFPSTPPPRPPSVGSMRAISVPPLGVPSPPSSSHMRSAAPYPSAPFVPSASSSAISVPPPPPSSTRLSADAPAFPSSTRLSAAPPAFPPSGSRISAFPPSRERK
jgi:hypothetical protein